MVTACHRICVQKNSLNFFKYYKAGIKINIDSKKTMDLINSWSVIYKTHQKYPEEQISSLFFQRKKQLN